MAAYTSFKCTAQSMHMYHAYFKTKTVMVSTAAQALTWFKSFIGNRHPGFFSDKYNIYVTRFAKTQHNGA